MKLNSNIILKVLNVFTWVGFIGLCIKAGAVIFSFLISLFRYPIAAKNLYMGLDLSQLKEQDYVAYIILVCCVVSIFILQAIMFFVLLQIFKKINMVSPFNEAIGELIFKLSLYALVIGVLSKLTLSVYATYLAKGINSPNLIEHIGHGDTFVFFAGILFFIAVLFKKGIELQTENDLTI